MSCFVFKFLSKNILIPLYQEVSDYKKHVSTLEV